MAHLFIKGLGCTIDYQKVMNFYIYVCTGRVCIYISKYIYIYSYVYIYLYTNTPSAHVYIKVILFLIVYRPSWTFNKEVSQNNILSSSSLKRFVTSKFNERNINHLLLNKICQRQSKWLRSNYAHAEYITRLKLVWVHILRIVRSYLYSMIFSRCWMNEFLELTSGRSTWVRSDQTSVQTRQQARGVSRYSRVEHFKLTF